MKRNVKAFGKVEFIVILGVLIVLIAFGAKYAIDTASGNNYSMLKKEADNFLRQVIYAKDTYPVYDDFYYLDTLLDNKIELNISNPFDRKKTCDRYESYVKIDGSKEVVLKCSNYIIYSKDTSYTVYELGEWTEYNEEIENNNSESSILYNYTKNGKEISGNYMLEKEFIDFYKEKENKKITNIEDVNTDDTKLVTKVLYRVKKQVKKVD